MYLVSSAGLAFSFRGPLLFRDNVADGVLPLSTFIYGRSGTFTLRCMTRTVHYAFRQDQDSPPATAQNSKVRIRSSRNGVPTLPLD